MSSVSPLPVALEVADGIAVIRLNRPDKMNAMTRAMVEEIIAMLDALDRDDAVRAVIFTGTGAAFCAGADLAAGARTFDYDAHAERSGNGVPVGRDGGGMLTLRLFSFLKPVIGAVNGAAVGLGATMLLPMDIRIAADTAKVGFVFARRGIVPEAASSWFLPRLVGISTALEWCYSGRLVPAAEGLERGLFRSVHKADELLDAAYGLAQSLTRESAPVSVAVTRQMMWRMMGASHPMEAHRADSRGVFLRGRSDDAREGIQAFLDKRDAAFPDRVSTDLPDIFPGWREPEF